MIKTVPQTSPLTPTHFSALEKGFGANPHRFCDLTKWNTWLWSGYLSAYLCEADGQEVLCRKMMDGTPTYTALCADPLSPSCIESLRQLAQKDGHALCLFPLTEAEKDGLLSRYPDACAETSPDWSDYLYSLESLAGFHGKKYNGQRNHLNRFHALYPDFSCVTLDRATRNATLAFLSAFYEENPVSPATSAEQEQILRLVETAAFDGLDGLYGQVVTDGDKVVAMAIGEVEGDTLYVHAEKALRNCRGAYQAIVSGFASHFLEMDVRFINREEDDGNEGLRTSKLSYHPVEVLAKWRVTFPSLSSF